MEADIARFYPGVDYGDRWRYDKYGRPRLTLRKLALLVRHLPDDSAVAAIGRDGPRWTVEAHLLDEVRVLLLRLLGAEANNAKPHPQRPLAIRRADPVREKKFADARRRAREHREWKQRNAETT